MTTAVAPRHKKPTPREWIVTPHGPIEKLEENLWVVEGTVPTPGGIKRRMSIVRRNDGSLVFYHAIPLEERALAEILAWGHPAALVLGHHQHAIDAAPFSQRLNLKIYGPERSLAHLHRRGLDVAGPLSALAPDPSVRFEDAEGTKTGDAIGIVTSEGRVSLLFADCCQNSPAAGMFFLFRWLGFAGGPKVVPVFRFAFMSDATLLRVHLARLAATPNLARLVPFHGTVVDVDAAAALKRASEW
jgi:hypothetical protein